MGLTNCLLILMLNQWSLYAFQYLNSYLVKTAKKCIEGFPLTNSNYSEALDLLKTRYGNPQLVISAHMAKF